MSATIQTQSSPQTASADAQVSTEYPQGLTLQADQADQDQILAFLESQDTSVRTLRGREEARIPVTLAEVSFLIHCTPDANTRNMIKSRARHSFTHIDRAHAPIRGLPAAYIYLPEAPYMVPTRAGRQIVMGIRDALYCFNQSANLMKEHAPADSDPEILEYDKTYATQIVAMQDNRRTRAQQRNS